jgi:hypothetical protein
MVSVCQFVFTEILSLRKCDYRDTGSVCNLCTVRNFDDEFSVVITIVYRVNGYGKS